jgi:hypothetical protein
MRGHEHDGDGELGLRPKGDRSSRESDDLMYKAASAGRTDVLGPAGLLGLQRAVGNAGVGALVEEERSPVHDVVGSGGSPLDTSTRETMESRFGGQDFGDVRVHTGGGAHDSAKSVNAQAYTVGSNIVFQNDKYDPGSSAGQHMLAHELTHVVQQRSGPVEGTEAGGGVKISDPSDRFEREAADNADRVMSDPGPQAAAPAVAAPAAPSVQRHADGDEAMVQTIPDSAAAEVAVQREGEEEEEVAQTYVQREGEEEEEAAE